MTHRPDIALALSLSDWQDLDGWGIREELERDGRTVAGAPTFAPDPKECGYTDDGGPCYHLMGILTVPFTSEGPAAFGGTITGTVSCPWTFPLDRETYPGMFQWFLDDRPLFGGLGPDFDPARFIAARRWVLRSLSQAKQEALGWQGGGLDVALLVEVIDTLWGQCGGETEDHPWLDAVMQGIPL